MTVTLAVAMSAMCVGAATLRSRCLPDGSIPDAVSLLYCTGAIAISVLGGLMAMHVGARHLRRIEV